MKHKQTILTLLGAALILLPAFVYAQKAPPSGGRALPTTPVAENAVALDHQAVQYTWTYSGVADGFRLLDNKYNLIAEIVDPNARSFVETGLPPSTAVNGRRVAAYTQLGQGNPSAVFPEVVTHDLPAVIQTPVVVVPVQPAQLSVILSVETVSGAPINQPIDPNDTLKATIFVKNLGGVDAEGVVAGMSIPPYIVYQGGITFSIPLIPAGNIKTSSFNLHFDQDALSGLTNNPHIQLQAVANASNASISFQSNAINIEPDVSVLSDVPLLLPPPVMPLEEEEEEEKVTEIVLITPVIDQDYGEGARVRYITAGLAVVALILTVVSPVIWGYLPYLPYILQHYLIRFVGLFKRRKKVKEREFGVVYDSITKDPMELAVVRIFDAATNKLIRTRVTNTLGKYDLLLDQGSYNIEVKRPLYSFPSKIVSGVVDGQYKNLYQYQKGLKIAAKKIAVPDIAVDQMDMKTALKLAGVFKKVRLIIQMTGNYTAAPILSVGAVISLGLALAYSDPMQWLVFVVYCALLIMQLKFRVHIPKAWGVVYDVETNEALPLTTIQIIEKKFSKIAKSRMTDYQGRYYFTPQPGNYVIRSVKEGYQKSDKAIDIKKPNQRVKADIAMTSK